MTIKEVYENLCIHDNRNPINNYLYDVYYEKREPRTDCSCDNCFYGRDELALQIIKAREDVAYLLGKIALGEY